MCGIAGVVGGTQDLSDDVRLMCAAMVHRGPDDDGYFNEHGAHLGMRRLAIIDVTHGAQPIGNEDDSVVTVFNGEIYNYREIQQQLRARGHRLTTDSDTECLVHLYEDHGTNLLQHLRGMFGLAIWDRNERTLLLARDRVGKKPLYYYEDSGRLWFASELKSLMALVSTPTQVDPEAIYRYLTFKYVPDPLTILEGVRKLPPAHLLIWRSGRVRIERYWSLDYAPAGFTSSASEDELSGQLRDQILDATRIRMISERPLGAFLSGGLDSSAVVAAMARTSTDPVRTFSIGFSHDEYNELPHARRIAEIYGTTHNELVVEPSVQDLLPRLARAYDEPFADSSAVPSFLVAEMTRRDVVVALNGDGGDESFGGYRTYTNFLTIPPRLRLPTPLVAAMRAGSAFAAGHQKRNNRLNRAVTGAGSLAARHPWQRYGRLTSTFTPEELQRLLKQDVLAALGHFDPYNQLEAAWRHNERTDPLNRTLAMDIGGYLPGDLLPKVDISTMAVSLEARSPLLDHHLMEWAAALPGTLKVRGGTTKYLMKKALAPWLPDDLIHRKKMGFGIPVAAWLRGPLQPMVRDLLFGPDSRSGIWVHRHVVESIFRDLSETGRRSGQIWSLLMLELWARSIAKSS